MTNPTEPKIYLDFYEDENMQTVWCWKKDATYEASQELFSEEEAVAAWSNDELTWSRLDDDGYLVVE